MKIDCTNITIDLADQAIRAYNAGCYTGGIKNPELDRQARTIFAGGLARSLEGVHEQVRFIGIDYGGVAGFKKAYRLAPAIAQDIHSVRDRYAEIGEGAKPLMESAMPIELLTELYGPFVKELHGRSNWHVWAAKFWHFLNPEAFPIEDSRVDKFFRVSAANGPAKYLILCHRFHKFVTTHQAWVPALRETDGGLAWCDNKLWDKVCYGIVELES